MSLTPYALDMLGFRRLTEAEKISASFSSFHIFEISGISAIDGLLVVNAGNIDGVEYRIAIAHSLNEACRKIANEDFADDEAAWVKEHKCTPPFLLIQLGPTSTYEMSGDFCKLEPFGLVTHEAFLPASKELREMERRVMPKLLSALSCALGNRQNPIRLRELERVVGGRSTHGLFVYDFGTQAHIEVRKLETVSAADLNGLLQCSVELAHRMNSQVANFHHLGLKETDPLKQFLFLFLTIERETHVAFKSINHRAHIATLLSSSSRVHLTSQSFFGSQPERWKSLQERFTWCALTVWSHLTDEDITSFTKVKKVRDQIAHGDITEPTGEAVAIVWKLASKLQFAPRDDTKTDA